MELARWYVELAEAQREGRTELDGRALDLALRRALVERGVLPEFVETELERVKQVVFAV